MSIPSLLQLRQGLREISRIINGSLPDQILRLNSPGIDRGSVEIDEYLDMYERALNTK